MKRKFERHVFVEGDDEKDQSCEASAAKRPKRQTEKIPEDLHAPIGLFIDGHVQKCPHKIVATDSQPFRLWKWARNLFNGPAQVICRVSISMDDKKDESNRLRVWMMDTYGATDRMDRYEHDAFIARDYVTNADDDSDDKKVDVKHADTEIVEQLLYENRYIIMPEHATVMLWKFDDTRKAVGYYGDTLFTSLQLLEFPQSSELEPNEKPRAVRYILAGIRQIADRPGGRSIGSIMSMLVASDQDWMVTFNGTRATREDAIRFVDRITRRRLPRDVIETIVDQFCIVPSAARDSAQSWMKSDYNKLAFLPG
jgi:hypothetical protein